MYKVGVHLIPIRDPIPIKCGSRAHSRAEMYEDNSCPIFQGSKLKACTIILHFCPRMRSTATFDRNWVADWHWMDLH